MKGGVVTAVRGADVLRGSPFDADLVLWKPRLNPERAPGAPLAREAMADRDPDRFAFGCELELSAAAGGVSRRHGEVTSTVWQLAQENPSGWFSGSHIGTWSRSDICGQTSSSIN